jgi:hypothetical protein
LDQIHIFPLEIGLLESDIRCFAKLLVRSEEMILKIYPSLLNLRFLVPFGEVVFEMTSFV